MWMGGRMDGCVGACVRGWLVACLLHWLAGWQNAGKQQLQKAMRSVPAPSGTGATTTTGNNNNINQRNNSALEAKVGGVPATAGFDPAGTRTRISLQVGWLGGRQNE